MEVRRALCGRFAIVGFLVIGLIFGETCNAKACSPSSCGNIHNISCPFQLKDDLKNCGDLAYCLSCENSVTVLQLHSAKYHVKSINHNNNTIRVVDPGFQKNNCSSIPFYSLSSDSIYARYPYSVYDYEYSSMDRIWISRAVTFIKCANPVNSSLYVDTTPCINSTTGGPTSLSQPRTYSYVVVVGPTVAWDLEEGCSIGWTAIS
ncbi:hypothetical protein CerSpe_074250 [Prunus speciosa]